MFGWIEHIFSSVGSAISDAVKAFVHALIRGVYAFVHDVFRAQWDAWNAFWDGAYILWRGARALSLSVVTRFRHLYQVVVKWLAGYILWVYHTVVHLAYVLYRDAITALDHAYHALLGLLDQLRKWVINDVWNPLFRSLTAAWHWLQHEGATIWFYFTHLPQFAELLFWHVIHSLERHAWDVAKYLGQFFLALFVHNVIRVASLLENVIDAVL